MARSGNLAPGAPPPAGDLRSSTTLDPGSAERVCGGLVLEAAGALPFAITQVTKVCHAAATRLLRCGFLALALLLAIDAQRRHRTRQQAPERDRLAALLAHVDLVVLQAVQLLGHLAQQELLAVVQPHLGREDLF